MRTLKTAADGPWPAFSQWAKSTSSDAVTGELDAPLPIKPGRVLGWLRVRLVGCWRPSSARRSTGVDRRQETNTARKPVAGMHASSYRPKRIAVAGFFRSWGWLDGSCDWELGARVLVKTLQRWADCERTRKKKKQKKKSIGSQQSVPYGIPGGPCGFVAVETGSARGRRQFHPVGIRALELGNRKGKSQENWAVSARLCAAPMRRPRNAVASQVWPSKCLA